MTYRTAGGMKNSDPERLVHALQDLRNRYFVMRHGESEANILGVAVGDPRRGLEGFGLTALGRRQAAEAAEGFKKSHGPLLVRAESTEIVASDFQRTRETAELFAAGLGNRVSVKLDSGLRERSFGELEGQHYRAMSALLETEGREGLVRRYGCEAPEAVQSRVLGVIRDLEEERKKRVLILVSHADPIQLLMTAFAGLDVSEYERIVAPDYAEFAELRVDMPLHLKNGTRV